MPDPQRMPLAHRIGPQRAGWIKMYARKLYEGGGLSFREVALKIEASQGECLTHAAIRAWAAKEGWRVEPDKPPPNERKKRPPTSEQSKVEASTKCRRRCQTCLKLIEPGETHICEIRAGNTIPIFGGSFL